MRRTETLRRPHRDPAHWSTETRPTAPCPTPPADNPPLARPGGPHEKRWEGPPRYAQGARRGKRETRSCCGLPLPGASRLRVFAGGRSPAGATPTVSLRGQADAKSAGDGGSTRLARRSVDRRPAWFPPLENLGSDPDRVPPCRTDRRFRRGSYERVVRRYVRPLCESAAPPWATGRVMTPRPGAFTVVVADSVLALASRTCSPCLATTRPDARGGCHPRRVSCVMDHVGQPAHDRHRSEGERTDSGTPRRREGGRPESRTGGLPPSRGGGSAQPPETRIERSAGVNPWSVSRPHPGQRSVCSSAAAACAPRLSRSTSKHPCVNSLGSPSHQRCDRPDRPVGIAMDVLGHVFGERRDDTSSTPGH